MPDTKITALTAIGANPIIPATFPIPMVDLTDTSMAASGTTKKVTVNQILGAGGTATLASATITGALTAQGTQVKLANQAAADCTVLIGPDSPSATRSGRIGFITSSTEKNWFIANNWNVPGGLEITQSTAAGGSTMSSNPTFRINNNSDFLFLDGAGGTRMTLNATGLGVGTAPANDKLLSLGSMGILLSGATSDFSFRNAGGTAIQRLRYTDSTGGLTIGSAVATAYPVELGGSTASRAIVIDSSINSIINVTSTAPALAANNQMVFNLTSNTNLRISVRGTDGTTRTADLTLAP